MNLIGVAIRALSTILGLLALSLTVIALVISVI